MQVQLWCALIVLGVFFVTSAPVGSIPMTLVNHAGSTIELYWIDTFTKKGKRWPAGEDNLVKQTQKPLRNATDAHINSYDTHQFLVRFLKHEKGNEVTFVKGPREETITITADKITGKLGVTQTTKFDEIANKIKYSTKTCSSLHGDAFTECVTNSIMDDVMKISDSKQKLTSFRDQISNRLRNYTCDDDTLETTTPIDIVPFNIKGIDYEAEFLLKDDTAKIWYVRDFVSNEECDILMKHGRPLLRRATVAAEDGSSVVSENRKAQQASYELHHTNMKSDPLFPLYDRVLAVTNGHGKMRLKPEGQEDFTIIQYNIADQYTPHCDGSCDNTEHISGGRVATAVLYCKIPERGGGTTFTKADVFVKPEKGMATFFTYWDPETNLMDEGYTEHSGCPVLDGEKWITTVWMRDGVTTEENWTVFDPNGVRMLDEEEQKLADLKYKKEDDAAANHDDEL